MKLPVKVALSTALLMTFFILLVFGAMHKQLTNNIKNDLFKNFTEEQHSINKQIDSLLKTSIDKLKLTSVINKKAIQNDKLIKKRYDLYLKNFDELKSIIFIPMENYEKFQIVSKKSFSGIQNKLDIYKNNMDKYLEKELTLSSIYYDSDNIMSLDIAIVLRDVSTYEKVGVAIAQLSLKNIQKFIIDKLVRFDGVVLSDLKNKEIIYKSSDATDIDNEYFFTNNEDIIIVNTHNREHIIASSQYNNNNLNLNISLLMHSDNLFKDINKTLKENIIKLLITILITTFALILLMQRLLKPLIKLTQSIKTKLKTLDDLTTYETKNEIEQLDNYFNRFINIIEEKNKELKDFNKQLQNRVEEEVRKNQEKQKYLIQQNKLAQMGEMINMIAHQWRQPLSAISSTTNTLILKSMMKKYDPELFNEKLKNISDYSQHLSSTIDDFRNFFKQSRTKKEASLKEICEDSIKIIEPTLRDNHIKIIKEHRCEKEILTYPNELKQVILNLIKNAEDLLKEKTAEDKWIKITINEIAGNLVIEVSDNAGGVPEEIIDKIFEPYFSTKLEKDGTGLGLYMSKIIIEEHCKGKITVRNSSHGAVFSIELPLNP